MIIYSGLNSKKEKDLVFVGLIRGILLYHICFVYPEYFKTEEQNAQLIDQGEMKTGQVQVVKEQPLNVLHLEGKFSDFTCL